MVETRHDWQADGYAESMRDALARREQQRRADFELSERLGAELLAELDQYATAA
jgi:hypothetical protein